MSIFPEQLQPVAVGSQENRVEALRLLLGYPLKQRDPEGSRFWFLRPGVDEDEAEDTCPIAVGFYSELNHLSKDEILQFFTADEQQNEIYGHYTDRIVPNQPVMYLLLPDGDRSGRVTMVLPSEGKFRRRQIQSFGWMEQDLQARLNRLRQSELARTDRMQEKALSVIPLVEWAFYKPIETAKELAEKLAEVSRKIEQAIPTVYDAERLDGYLHTLLTSFQRELLPMLKLKPDNDKDYSFADIYAQTIAYGLFTARVFSYTIDERKRQEEQNPKRKETDFNRQNAWERLPETNPFLRRLFRDVSQQPVAELGEDLVDAITEVFSILRAAKMDAILADFRAKMNREDIVIRFYEDFLAAYKPKMRERRGVYYTPEPVVSYMVRSVDILLKEKFNKPLGLADPEVMILDPACGTGTFLLWIFQEIHRKFQENPELLTVGLEDKSWSEYVKERLLPRVFGFELLMAPYAIAHLKLGLFLEETGYQFASGRRLGVYLTNTLDDSIKKAETLFEEFIAEESDQAASIKRDKPVMVLIGNPPYSIHSQNLTESARSLVDPYRFLDGVAIKEKGALQFEKNIQNDYVKFMRFSQMKIASTGYGIFAVVTDHGYLDGPTFRGMRQSLKDDFNEIFLINLHGSSKKKEKCVDGTKDENVFDIQQGVSISIFAKTSRLSNLHETHHSDLWGLRENKYFWLLKNNIITTNWKSISSDGPNYLFVDEDSSLREEYEAGYKLTNAMEQSSSGIITARDHAVIDFEKHKILENAVLFKNSTASNEWVCNQLEISIKKGWDITRARRSIKQEDNLENCIQTILYRPFDIRRIFYHPSLVWGMAFPTMRHMLSGTNIGFVVPRRVETSGAWTHILVSEQIIEHVVVSLKTTDALLPLYLYPDVNSPQGNILDKARLSNFSQQFLTNVAIKLGYRPTSESIFYYIYSILYSSNYRTRYAGFLKNDFPYIPLTSNKVLFCQLSAYGEELVALHLMKSPRLDTLATAFVDAGGSLTVDPGHPKYDDSSSSVLINKKGDKFTGVPKAVWEFYVGGYQVCHKWLKDRKGRTLSENDITHYQRIVVALQETMSLMQQIDEAIPGFPIE